MKRIIADFSDFERQFDAIVEKLQTRKKIDQDGDGDTDFVDAKIAQYKKGGIPPKKAIAKAKVFAKKNNIPDDGNIERKPAQKKKGA